jgi:hypothetical protein
MSKEISIETVAARILVIRGKKVMLDRDLAQLYGVTTGRFNEQVKRNLKRFPNDFMFVLQREEVMNLISQNAISSWGGHRKLPCVFTEQGVAMLSSILNSERAIDVNIAIMRAFVKLREFLMTHKEVAEKIDVLEKKYSEHDKKFVVVFEAIRRLLEPVSEPKKPQIGFKTG